MKGISRLDWVDTGCPALEPRRPDVLERQVIIGEAQQIPFDLEADAAFHATFCQAFDLSPQKMPRGKMEGLAGDEIFVAQNPADIRLPGKDPEGRGVGNDGQIWRPRHFVEVHPASSREGSKGP